MDIPVKTLNSTSNENSKIRSHECGSNSGDDVTS